MPTKQRFSWLTRDRSSPSARLLAIALLSFVTFACLVSIVYLLARPKPLNPYQQAAELDALIHRDPRFAEVTAQASYPGVVVLVTGQLSDDTRSDLERFVREHAPHLDTPIRYFPTDAELTPTNPPAVVTSPLQLPSLVGQRVELVGVVSNTKCPYVQGVDMWELEAYRGRTARVTGILRSSVVTEQQLREEQARFGMFANRGPATFYRLEKMKYEILP